MTTKRQHETNRAATNADKQAHDEATNAKENLDELISDDAPARGFQTNNHERPQTSDAPSQFDEPSQFDNEHLPVGRQPSRIFDALTSSENSERAWHFVSIACLAVAAACLVLWHVDAAFVAAAVGAIAWFLSLRNRLLRQSAESEARESLRDEEKE